MSLKLADGVVFNVAAANDLLEGIEVGNTVTVQITKGWADMVEIAEGKGMPTPVPETTKERSPVGCGRSNSHSGG